MAGRKPLYDTENLEIGSKIELRGKSKKFKDQYLYTLNNRSRNKFRQIVEGKKVFLERIS